MMFLTETTVMAAWLWEHTETVTLYTLNGRVSQHVNYISIQTLRREKPETHTLEVLTRISSISHN